MGRKACVNPLALKPLITTDPLSAELICKKTSQQKGFFQFEIIINVLVSSF